MEPMGAGVLPLNFNCFNPGHQGLDEQKHVSQPKPRWSPFPIRARATTFLPAGESRVLNRFKAGNPESPRSPNRWKPPEPKGHQNIMGDSSNSMGDVPAMFQKLAWGMKCRSPQVTGGNPTWLICWGICATKILGLIIGIIIQLGNLLFTSPGCFLWGQGGLDTAQLKCIPQRYNISALDTGACVTIRVHTLHTKKNGQWTGFPFKNDPIRFRSTF